MEEKKMTGYPSIDKPWSTLYRTIPIREVHEKQTLYQLVFSANSGNIDSTAISYMGYRCSFRQLQILVDDAANAFTALGVKENDVITLALITVLFE